MKKNRIIFGAILAVIAGSCTKINTELSDAPKIKNKLSLNALASPAGDVVGKVTVGYQGWFTAAGDGSPQNSWGHQNLESWPDTREYTTTYQTSLPALGNGQPAKMFSSWDQSTVNKHFQWMQQYDIDCAAVQRFCNEITPGSQIKTFRDGIATRAKNAAQTYNRKFYIMYDASGWGNLAAIKADWTNTITASNGLNLLTSSAYARQNGKPVVSIYGLGYANHPSSSAEALDLINWFKGQGCYVIGSVPGQWRTGTGDSKSGFIDAYKAFDMISGWAVGRVVDAGYTSWVTGDRDFCNANNMDYQPCAYPGTSFYNTNGSASPQNQFPRSHGDFLWSQFAVFKNAGVQSMYVAMFDELNEGTQIFKTAENASQAPSGHWYLNMDADGVAVSSDFYLRLTSDGGKMIKGMLPYSAAHPTAHTITSGATFYANTNYGGAASQVLPVGNYSLSQLSALGMPNDWASSVKVTSGRTVIMYSDDNFSGQSWTLTADTPNLGALVPSANDIISSIKVQ